MKITDEMLAKAAGELMAAMMKSLPAPEDCHHEFSPEFEEKMAALLAAPEQDPYLDPTGVRLTPSYHGKDCLGNGNHPGGECCCDECAWYLECWPDWGESEK